MNKETRKTRKLYSDLVKKEWKRLEKYSYFRLEFDTSMVFLKKYLPKKGLILDAGGGPGRYTIELAKEGYNVVLLDLVPENLEFASRKIKQGKLQNKIKQIIEGNIIKLPFKNNTFDAVICLGGPLSHVHPEKNRKKAISELIRVAKKGAPIFVAVMGKFGVLMNSLRFWPEEVKMKRHFERFSQRGDDYMWHGGKGYCHFFTKDELEKLFYKKNIKIIEEIGLEGLATTSRDITKKLFKNQPKIKRNWMKMHYKTCTHPTVIDLSAHIMIIVKKLK